MKRRCPGAVGRPGAFAEILRPGPPVGRITRPGGAVPPAGWLRNEVVCHDMRKKVIPFPPRKAEPSRPVTLGHSRITVQVGAHRYTLNIPCQGVALPPESKNGTTINEVVSRALVVQLGTLPGYARAPGPEKTPIALDLVEQLASIGCTLEEIGAVVGVSSRTLIRRQKEEKFHDAIDRGRRRGQRSLRTAQWAAAESDKVTMLIWLGK